MEGYDKPVRKVLVCVLMYKGSWNRTQCYKKCKFLGYKTFVSLSWHLLPSNDIMSMQTYIENTGIFAFG